MKEAEITELLKARDERGAEEFLKNYSPLIRYVVSPISIANGELPVGETNSLRGAHDGVTAVSYQIWCDADGNEINRVELPNSYYSTISAQIEVGTLNPDGTQATLDTSTGALTGVVEGPAETETNPDNPNPDQPVDPAVDPAVQPQENPDGEAVEMPADPPAA